MYFWSFSNKRFWKYMLYKESEKWVIVSQGRIP